MDNLIVAGALIFVLTAAMGAAVALFLGRNRFYRLRDYERVAVFHISGRFAGMRGPGFGFIGFNLLPPEGPPIDLRDQVDAIAAEQCITADSSVVNVAPVVVYKITDPGQMITEVKNPEAGIGSATIAALRAIIGTMTLQEVITGRETITAGMKERVSEQAQRWGISIIYVEIQSIRVSAEVERAMNERRANVELAEAERRTAELRAEAARQQYVVEADAKRQGAESESAAQRTLADAEKYAIIARAEGEKAAEELRAQGVAVMYSTLRNLGEDVDAALKYEQIQALRTLGAAPNAKLVIVPENLARFDSVRSVTRLENAVPTVPVDGAQGEVSIADGTEPGGARPAASGAGG